MLSREKRLFFLRWLKNPWRMGVPVPSSKVLARAMAAQLAILQSDEYVVELGPGTGVVTKALCHAGIKQRQLIIIEREAAFIAKLKKDFPDALVLEGDARDICRILSERHIHQVAAIVSSLPLLSIPDSIRKTIMHEAFKVVKSDGLFIQYTYGLLSPVPARLQRDVGIHGKVAKHIWRNFPPARVWRYKAQA